MRHADPLLEEVFVATVAVTCFGAFVALLFWLFTGQSPWPMFVLGELAGLGFGIALLVMASPRHRR